MKIYKESIVPVSPKAVMQIIHGMMEHSGRYLEFANWLADLGIAVYLSDHYGHGKNLEYIPGQVTKGNQVHGHFADKDGWKNSLEALHEFNLDIRENHPGLPVFMLGHSMGSVMLQSYMQKFNEDVAGFILSGTMSQPKILINAGILLADSLKAIYGPHYRSRLLISLGYGSYSRYFKPKRTDFDWLCSDPAVVDAYVADPFCGFPSTAALYCDFFRGIRENIHPVPSESSAKGSLLIIGGENDPAGRFGKDPKRFAELYRKAGYEKVDLKLWPDGRHEMLNEVNKKEVWEYIYSWIIGQLADGQLNLDSSQS